MRGTASWMLLLGLAGPAIAPSHAVARPWKVGDVEGIANVELSYGLLARIEERDPDLVALVNGGRSASANFDDGNLNYDRGIASNVLQASGEIAARWRFLGVYARGIAYYDFATELSDRERTDLSNGAERYVGKRAELRDYYLEASLPIGGMPLRVRVGDQLLNWGESTFLRFGVETVNPLDLVALFRPASSARDLRIPQGMVWAAANVTETVAVEGYYQYAWRRVRTAPIGSLFSDNDTVGAGGLGGAMAGEGLFSDLGTDLDAAFGLPSGTLGFDPDFLRIPGRGTDEPKSQGQFGVTVQSILPSFNSTKLALHFENYHSRLPLISARTGDAAAVAATSRAAVAARAAALAPVYQGQGLSPAEATLAATRTASALALGEYASEASYFVTYPENVQMLGLSFNTATINTGTLISGEISHHFNHPFQILPSDVFNAAFAPIGVDPSFAQGPLGPFAPGQVVSGVERRGKTQVEIGLRQLLGPRLGASQTIVGIDAGWVHVHGMPDPDRLRLSAPGVTGRRDFDHLPDADSWGYRVVGALTYESVLGAFTVQPRVAWLHDVHGVTPGPGGSFVAGRKAVAAGVSVDYTNTWLLQLDYTSFFGAGRFHMLNDRDFVRFQLTYSY